MRVLLDTDCRSNARLEGLPGERLSLSEERKEKKKRTAQLRFGKLQLIIRSLKFTLDLDGNLVPVQEKMYFHKAFSMSLTIPNIFSG